MLPVLQDNINPVAGTVDDCEFPELRCDDCLAFDRCKVSYSDTQVWPAS